MTRIQRLMHLHKLMGPANDGTEGSGGGGGGGDDAAAKAAAEKAAADKAAADKAAADKAAAEAEAARSALSDKEAALLKDVMKQKEKAEKAEKAAAEAQARLKDFEGIDPVKIRALLKEQEEAENKRLEARGEYDRLVKQMGERHTAEKSALEQQIEAAKAAAKTLSQQIADMTVGSAFTGSKFVAEDLTLTPAKARVVYGSHFEFVDGKVVGFDKPAGASERTKLVDAAGNVLSFDEALRKLVEADPDKDHLIRSKVRPGSGSNTNNKGARQAGGDTGGKSKTSIEKIASGLKALGKQTARV
jgi:hypothetical protein